MSEKTYNEKWKEQSMTWGGKMDMAKGKIKGYFKGKKWQTPNKTKGKKWQ